MPNFGYRVLSCQNFGQDKENVNREQKPGFFFGNFAAGSDEEKEEKRRNHQKNSGNSKRRKINNFYWANQGNDSYNQCSRNYNRTH